MTLYRIYTEDKGDLAAIANRHVDAFSIFRGVGSWEGVQEPCAVIEVLDRPREVIAALAEDIRATNAQQAVMVVATDVQAVFVTAEGGN